MSDIVIRTAKKDYICAKCRCIIKKDSEYIDRVLLNKSRVSHERYHDECPESIPLVALFRNIMANGGRACCADTKGDKHYVSGIDWLDGEPCVKVYDWDNDFKGWVPYKVFKGLFHIY